MAEGIVKKCREFARSVQAKLNSYEYTILEKMSYSDWSTRNTNYNNQCEPVQNQYEANPEPIPQ